MRRLRERYVVERDRGEACRPFAFRGDQPGDVKAHRQRSSCQGKRELLSPQLHQRAAPANRHSRHRETERSARGQAPALRIATSDEIRGPEKSKVGCKADLAAFREITFEPALDADPLPGTVESGQGEVGLVDREPELKERARLVVARDRDGTGSKRQVSEVRGQHRLGGDRIVGEKVEHVLLFE